MSEQAPTNSDLAARIKDGFRNVRKEIKSVKDEFQTVKDEDIKPMKADIATLTNWMNYEKGRQSNVRSSNGSINWFELAKQFLVFLTVAASIVLVIVQVFAERTK